LEKKIGFDLGSTPSFPLLFLDSASIKNHFNIKRFGETSKYHIPLENAKMTKGEPIENPVFVI